MWSLHEARDFGVEGCKAGICATSSPFPSPLGEGRERSERGRGFPVRTRYKSNFSQGLGEDSGPWTCWFRTTPTPVRSTHSPPPRGEGNAVNRMWGFPPQAKGITKN